VMELANLLANHRLKLAKLQCTVLEVKVTPLGHTIDVILANGALKIGDVIVVCGIHGPIVTKIQALLTPQPLQNLQINSVYQHNNAVRAPLGLKIVANDLEHAVAGSQLFVVDNQNDNLEEIKERVMEQVEKLKRIGSNTKMGVCVQSSTLGALEALMGFLKQEKVPVASVTLGPVRKKDIAIASTMLETECPQYACILAFGVDISPEMKLYAEEKKVKIFEADIIHHLFEKFQQYLELEKRERPELTAKDAVFPCILKIYPDHVFHKKDPIIVGVNVVEGTLKLGTPLVIPSLEMLEIGV